MELGYKASVFILLAGFFLADTSTVSALSRDRSIRDFRHTAWTAKDGAPSQITALAQTQDGYLWIGSASGLFRFDGVEFEPYKPPEGVTLPANNIVSLLAVPDGSLWIVFRTSGLGLLKDGDLKIFSRPEELPKGEVFTLARDLDGRIWAGTLAGLALYDGKSWIEVGSDWNIRRDRIWSLLVDRNGTLWVATGTTIVSLPRGSTSFEPTGLQTNGVPHMTQAPDGRIWKTEWQKPVRPIPLAGVESQSSDPKIDILGYGLLFDRDGSLWMVGNYTGGVNRIRFPETIGKATISKNSAEIESFGPSDGLTDLGTSNLFEDREGNIWLTSIKGLDRFSYSPLVAFELPTGYSRFTLVPGNSGDLWIASRGGNPIVHLAGNKIEYIGSDLEIASKYREADGTIWWGGPGGLWRQRDYELKHFKHPETDKEWFWEIFSAGSPGSLWTRMGDLGLVHFENGRWTKGDRPIGLPDKGPSCSFEESSERTWLGYSNGDLYRLENGNARRFSREDGLDVGKLKVIRGTNDQLWLGGETGFALFQNGQFTSVNTIPEPLKSVSGIIETDDGSLWLNETRGVIHIDASERNRLSREPTHPVNYRLFDVLDGLPGNPQMNYTASTAVKTSDGRLWFSTDSGLAWVNPASLRKNELPPPVQVRSLTAYGTAFHPNELIELREGTEELRISYTALSLSVPERVQFKYRLEGQSNSWHDAGPRREASFTNLGPGKYRFHVIASNNDGVWNEEGAVLDFTILPRFYQTNWFLALCLAAAAFVVWLAYRWRLQQVKNLMHVQFQERLAERTRIAQDFHDTLLQGIASASMQLHAVSTSLSDESQAKLSLRRVQTLVGDLIEEGRNTIKGLRYERHGSSADLEPELFRLRQDLDIDKESEFRVVVTGKPVPLDPMVEDETIYIAREALANAYRHSGGSMIEVEIEYGARSFRLMVRDNGSGIDPDTLSTGREGHWGLKGMRERAERAGGKLKILSRPGAGTEVILSVPGHLAYGERSGRIVDALRDVTKWVRDKGKGIK